jgi:hypothetical protein
MSVIKTKMLPPSTKNKAPLSVLLLSCFLVAASSCSHRIGRPASPAAAAQFDEQSLKKLSRYLLQPPVRTSLPSFQVKESTLYYYLGDVLLEDVVPTSSTTSVPRTTSDPLGIALKDQLRIELVRQHIASHKNEDLSFLEPALEQSETIVSRELETLKNSPGSTPEVLLAKLDAYSQEIGKTMDRAIQQYALERRLNVFHITRKSLAAATYEVVFRTTPPGGVVSYVTEFDMKVALKEDSVPPWRMAAAKILLNAGSYRVHIVWADFNGKKEKKESEYPIDVSGNGELNLLYLPPSSISTSGSRN